MYPAKERGMEPPSARAARLAAELAELEREIADQRTEVPSRPVASCPAKHIRTHPRTHETAYAPLIGLACSHARAIAPAHTPLQAAAAAGGGGDDGGAEHLAELLAHCHDTPGVHLIDCPVDYSENDRILNHDIKTLSRAL